MTHPRIPRRLVLGLALTLVLARGGLRLAPAAADDAPKLAGTWSWEWKDAQGVTHHHLLDVEEAGTTRAARERFDDKAPVRVDDLKVQGRKVTFSVQRADRRATYSGTLDGPDTINGLVSVANPAAANQVNEFAWTARRKAPDQP